MRTDGYVKVNKEHLQELISVFQRAGFNPTILQKIVAGQIWGGVKGLDYHNEWHVRILCVSDGFEEFLIIESEIEIPRKWIQHISPQYPPDHFYEPVIEILYYYRIPFQIIGYLPPTPALVRRPLRYTEWGTPLASGLAILTGVILLWAASKIDN